LKTKIKLNAGVAALMAGRFVLAALLFREFFYFRMVNVACIFIFYLIADSVEETLVFRGAAWNKLRKVLAYAVEITMIFSITSGIVLRLPLYYFAASAGIYYENIGTHNILHLWLFITFLVAAFAIIFGFAIRDAWGASQYLLFRLSFLVYCSLWIPLWSSLALLIPVLILLATEGFKHNWCIKEMRKKDYRFRHSDPAVPPYPKQYKPPLG